MVLCTNPDTSQILAQSSHYLSQQVYFDDAALLSWPNSVVGNANVRFETSSCPPPRQHYFPESSTASSTRKRTASSVPTSPMPPKRPSESSPTGTPAKLQKAQTKPEDFSSSVKKRLQSSTRTGQACDRCKVRKIRCDGLETGCSPCAQNHSECKTTDRITGVAIRRGELYLLQQENDHLRDLLRKYGINSPLDNAAPNGYLHGTSNNGMPNPWNETPQPQTNLYAPAAPQSVLPSNVYSTLLSTTTQQGSIMDILSILGMNIHDEEMTAAEVETASPYDRTYKAFLQTAHGVSPRIPKVELPSREDGFKYAEIYFSMVNPYLPILHKSTFMTLLSNLYDGPSTLSCAETVIVHMVFAIMMFQFATRSATENKLDLNSASNLHYHFSLAKFYELSCSHTLQDVQAMTMICYHLRNFSKPDCSWMLSSHTMTLCKELGLHRQAKISDLNHTLSGYDAEIRKRVFWCVLTLNVGLSGKLGRPIPIHLDDFDIEMPEPMDDDHINECEIPLEQRNGRCAHHIGIQNFKLYALYLEMYMTIYAVKRHPETYPSTVADLQAKIAGWKEGWPPEVRDPRLSGNRVFPLYLELWYLEFKMLLRHPAVSMTQDAAYNQESTDICKESARQILTIVRGLKHFQSLDTTWYNAAVFVVAMTTMLFAVWEKNKKFGVTREEVGALRQEMEEWMGIMGDVGSLLGSGNRLRETIRKSIEPMLSHLIVTINPKPPTSFLSSHPSYDNTDNYSPPTHHSKSPHRGSTSHPPSTPSTTAVFTPQSYSSFAEPQAAASNSSYHSTPYPAATQYYPPPANSATSGYGESTQYPSFPDPVDAPLLAAFAEQASQQAGISAPSTENETWRGSYAGQGQNGHHHSGSAQSSIGQLQHATAQNGSGHLPAQYHSGSQGWQLFSTALAENMGSQEADSLSAAVLLELQQGTQKPVASNGQNGDLQVTMGGGWPGIVMDIGQNGQQ